MRAACSLTTMIPTGKTYNSSTFSYHCANLRRGHALLKSHPLDRDLAIPLPTNNGAVSSGDPTVSAPSPLVRYAFRRSTAFKQLDHRSDIALSHERHSLAEQFKEAGEERGIDTHLIGQFLTALEIVKKN